MDSNNSNSVFSRRPSFFGGKSRHKPSRSSIPPTLHLEPASPIREHEHEHEHKHKHEHEHDAHPPTPPPPPPPPDTTPPTASQSNPNPPARLPTTPHHRMPASRHSISSLSSTVGLQLRRSRSTSLRSAASAPSHHKRNPSASTMHSLSPSPEKGMPAAAPISASRPTLSISTFARTKAKSSDNVKPDPGALHHYDKAPLSALDKPKTPFAMAVPLQIRHPPSHKDTQHPHRQPSTTALAPAAPIPAPAGANPNLVFQHIHELASKRISTLDYLRKAHEGRIYWFNTLLFSKTDLARLPSFTPRNQSRRATHYLLLGFSLPTILDLHANSPAEYLRALNALLLEFEQYQSIHPPDGSAPGSLSRARIPHMFKRANLGGKGRRSSSATGDFPLLTPQTSFGSDSTAGGFHVDSPPTDDLLPNETYFYLQTPSLPFDPDFFSTFATLCDVLIDCYTKMLSMLSTPESVALAGQGVPTTVGDLFSKADARVRKIILAGVVREFEESCRAGVRGEVGGVGKVVLGGLM